MPTQTFRPGDGAVLAGDSPAAAFSAVFEDDGETGYFYALDRDRPQDARILDGVLIYAVDDLPPQVREHDTDLEIVWSADGLKAGLRIAGGLQAVLDFAAREAFCRLNLPPVSRWSGGARGAWREGRGDGLG